MTRAIAGRTLPAPYPTTRVDLPAPMLPVRIAGTGLTRVEFILRRDDFGGAVITGLEQSTRADRASVAAARKTQADMRVLIGYARADAAILTSGANQSKLGKNTVATLGLMLSPERKLMSSALADIRKAFNLAGGYNVCPLASKGCRAACLDESGQSGMPTAQRAQGARTAFLMARPHESGLIIGAELRAALKRHGAVNLRLNTTSDIRWELFAPDMITALTAAGVAMYDYTAWRPSERKPSDAYRLTYSAKETSHTSDAYLTGILAAGGNVAMPFDTPRGHALPATWNGFPVIDGDKSDERRLDPPGVVVGLRAKGYRWRRDNSAGFIRAAGDSL